MNDLSPRGLYADLLPPRRTVDLACELAGTIHWLEIAARDVRSGETQGLAIMLEDAARQARSVLSTPASGIEGEGRDDG